jgi:hypothetical protein
VCQFWSQPKIGVVDPEVLVAEQATKVAESYPRGVPAGKLQQIAEDIKNTTTRYAEEHRMLLLVKNAVWGGELPDHTDHILKMLKEE